MGHEQFRKLEQRTMTGIGIDDQLGSTYFLREIVGIDRRNHDVSISIHDEGWLPNVTQLGVPVAASFAPSDDRSTLGGHSLRRAWAIRVMLAEMTSLPKSFACSLARRRRSEKEIEKSLN